MALGAMNEAEALEAEVEEYPDERGEILLEAAKAWREAGRPDRADAALGRLIVDGGEDGCYARMQLAEDRFTEGAAAEAYAELDRLARDAALHDGHCGLVAELLAEREDLEGALRWYDRAVVRLSADELEELGRPDGWLRVSLTTLRGRMHVRQQLGLPPDATDELAIGADRRRRRAVGLPDPRDSVVHLAELSDAVESGRVPRQARMLVFQRAERAEACRRWPDAYDAADEEYYAAAERRWRGLAAQGVPSIRVVPATVAGLCEFAERIGESPLDSAVKTRYSETVAEQDVIAWPPSRNTPCWCGSGTKYKKCCGRAS
ncbi:SEC-C domain-containing protein [Plantactinospora sp. CA-290183]|uniref:SEC-C domain-containing protein n=1 Tax=Plantactinospora sp. CA-290183 TaxID=3240006 RepID=UPI003D944E33